MKRIFAAIILILGVATLIYLVDTKFYSTKSYIYKVSDTEKVKVTLNVKDGYKINGKDFVIKTDSGDVCTVGEFITEDLFNTMLNQVNTSENIRLIEDESTDTFQYVFYTIDEETYVYLIKMKDSDIYISLINTVSIDSAVKIFNRLTIEVI